MFGALVPRLFGVAQRVGMAVLGAGASSPSAALPGVVMPVRTKIRCYFPRPCESKRVKRHGWATRMSTLSGRKIIMRRILKGSYVLSH